MAKKQEKYYRVGQSPFIYAGEKCNNQCIFCFEADRTFPHKTIGQIKKEMKTIRQNFDFINLMGQEPTLRNDIIELINYGKILKFREIGLTTNGRMFAYRDFAKKILDSGLNQIGLTVAGADAETHDQHTLVKGSFKQTLAGIKNILLLKNHDFSFLLNIMITNRNCQKLSAMVDFYVGLGIREINLGHIMPLNKKIVNSKEIIAQMKDVVPYLTDAQDKYGDMVKFLFVEYPACIFPKDYRHLAFPCLEENPQKKRIELCQKCKYKKTCNGISGAYLNLYGDQEFKI